MTFRRMRAVASAVSMSIAALWLSGPASMAQTVDLRVATEVAAGGDVHILVEAFGAALQERVPNANVRIFAGGALGTQRQLQEQVELGTIEAIGTASDIVEMAGEFSIFDLPFLFTDSQHAFRAMDGRLGEMLNEILVERRGVRVIGYGQLGFRQITNNLRPIDKPEDLAGLKIRTPSNPLRIETFKALGAAPTPIPYSELYSALQAGVVDGQENPLLTIQEQSLWEVQRYVAMTNHVFTPAYLLVNEEWWQGLDDGTRAVLAEAGRQAAQRQRQKIDDTTDLLIETVQAKGMQVTRPNPAPFIALTRPLWAGFEQKYGSALVEAAVSAR
ncbi:TRAP transporter substrate-binding protein [Rhodoligotrophos defluvii]|uniref:TRAP transporter substrate-binding protein n=1 Tax=Rhodoligotrophos defluvii TaxID=2561934 RepID=UPI0010C9DBE1|nr:TRAP transporter substrate-binding protein [Rhodoligotrophos defluvii]